VQTLNPAKVFDEQMLGVHVPADVSATVTTGAGYDATRSTPRRKPPAARTRREDEELTGHERVVAATATRNLHRNFEIAAWAIRKHLDYVSTFAFQASTGNDGLDDAVEAFVKEWSEPQNCDATRRFSLGELIRVAEARRTVDGDCLVPFRKDGKLQIVEGDRVGNPAASLPARLTFGKRKVTAQDLVNGVLLDADGGPLAYVVNRRRRGGGLEFEALLPATFVHHHAYFDRYDQARGISPLISAVNRLTDVYEGFEYALAKAKVEQLFAMVFQRKAAEAIGIVNEDTVTTAGGTQRTEYNVEFGKGCITLDLDPGDDAKFLQSDAPGSNFGEFTQSMVMVALKALDIPLSFFDEAHTNWVGQRAAAIQYEFSAGIKREANRRLLTRASEWRIRLAIVDGTIKLPAGFDPAKVRCFGHWIHKGMPWLDPLKEVSGEVAAVNAGLTSPQRVCAGKGQNFFDIIDERAEAEAYAAERHVTLSYGQPAAAAATDDDEDDDADKKDEADDGKQPERRRTGGVIRNRKPRRGT
jgi:capsid protein